MDYFNNLDEETRKKLFKEFQRIGGDPEAAKKRRRIKYIQGTKPIDPTKLQRETKKQSKKASKETKKIEKAKKRGGEKKGKTQKAEIDILRGTFIDSIKIYFKLVLMNVTDLSGNYISKSFRNSILNEVKGALINLQTIKREILPTGKSTTTKIIKALDKRTPLYYELISMVANIYDREDFSLFERAFEKKNEKVHYKKIIVPTQIFFRKLYILHKYSEAYKTAISTAIDLYAELEGRSKAFFAKRKSEIMKATNTVFYYFFPRLHLLFLKHIGVYIPLDFTKTFKELLYIKDEELPGNRKPLEEIEKGIDSLKGEEKQEESEGEEGEKEKKQKNIEDLPKHIQYGLKLMSYRPVAELRHKYDKENIFEWVSDYDKIFITAMLFYEFDEEYAVAIMSNKVKIDIDYSEGIKKDYKQMLSDEYSKSRECFLHFREYGKIVKDMKEVEKRKNTNYIAYIKELDSLKAKKIKAGNDARDCVKRIMTSISDILETLLDPQKPQSSLILNPEEPLVFELEADKKRKLNGKKVITALKAVYCYASALAYRLSQEGDLFGGEFELTEEEALTPIRKRSE